jgi:hypothetical protein
VLCVWGDHNNQFPEYGVAAARVCVFLSTILVRDDGGGPVLWRRWAGGGAGGGVYTLSRSSGPHNPIPRVFAASRAVKSVRP